jgi:hypothetical protein
MTMKGCVEVKLYQQGRVLSIRTWSNGSHHGRKKLAGAPQQAFPLLRKIILVYRQREGKGSAALLIVRSLHGPAMGFNDRPADSKLVDRKLASPVCHGLLPFSGNGWQIAHFY